MIDLHSHILPEIDDGASDWEASIEMCRIAAADGTTIMVATPHMCDGLYNVSREMVFLKVEELRRRLEEAEIPLEVLPGADIHIEVDLPILYQKGALVTINDTGKYLLIEFPHDIVPSSVEKLLFSLKMAGVTPIITHPERNQEVQRNIKRVYGWVNGGNLIQVTAASITGELGKSAKTCALKLLKSGLVHIIASDAHSPTWRCPGLSKARVEVSEFLSDDQVRDIFDILPQKIINGEEIEVSQVEEAAPPKRGKWFFW